MEFQALDVLFAKIKLDLGDQFGIMSTCSIQPEQRWYAKSEKLHMMCIAATGLLKFIHKLNSNDF